jgi:hypothetical protein
MPTARPTTGRTLRLIHVVLGLTIALGLVALGSWGYFNPQRYVVVETFLNHVFVFGVLAALLAGWALGRLTRHRKVRVLLVTPAVIVACIWGLWGITLTVAFGGDDVVTQVPAPHSPYKAVVTSTPMLIDPAWVISIRQTGSLTARDYEVGCINGDAPQYTFHDATWIDAEHLELELEGHTVTIRVDPNTGKPFPVSGDAWKC